MVIEINIYIVQSKTRIQRHAMQQIALHAHIKIAPSSLSISIVNYFENCDSWEYLPLWQHFECLDHLWWY